MITTEPEVLEIEQAEYSDGYKIRLQFNDGTSSVVDFANFLSNAKNPMMTQFRRKKLFQNFRIEYGDLMWGDYEMCFPVADLYDGKI
jgi:hypothetical protein